jgi:hypothetical protein
MNKELFTAVTIPYDFYWLKKPDKYQFGQGAEFPSPLFIAAVAVR